MSRGQKAIAAGLCLALAAGSATLVPLGAIASPQDDLDAALENRDAINEQLEASQANLDEAAERLSQIGQQLSASEAELAEATERLEQTAYEVQMKEIEVANTQEDLSYQRELLSNSMRSGYKSGPVQFIEFLLGSTSIEDFINRVYYMDKVSESEARTIEEVEELQAQLEDEQAELEARQGEEQRLVNNLNEKVTSYNSSLAEAQEYYDSLDEEVQAALAEQAAAEEAVEKASYMLEVYEALKRAEEQRRAAEEARRQAEEEERARAEAEAQARAEAEAEAQRQAEAEAEAQRQAEAEAEARRQAEQEQQQQQQQSQGESGNGGSGNGNNSGSGNSSSSSGSGVSASVQQAVNTAYAQVGKPYVYGAAGPDSFDCSGLVLYCYGNKYGHGTGYMISGIQAAGNWKTSMSELEYGDLVFPSSGHVGIYIGDGMMIHAANPSTGVVISQVYAFYGGGPY